MKKLLFLCSLIGILFTSCADDIDDRVPKRRPPTPSPAPIPTPNQGILITPLTDSSTTHMGGSQRGENPDDLPSNHSFTEQVLVNFTESSVTVTSHIGISFVKRGAHITLTSSANNIEYILSGSASSGSFKLISSQPYRLTLNNLSLSNEDGAAIHLRGNGKAFIHLNDDTNNFLSDGTTYSSIHGEDPTATLYSTSHMIIDGEGKLSIKGKYKHGIASLGYLHILNGEISITEASENGIQLRSHFIGDGGTISINNQNGQGNALAVGNGSVIINQGKYLLKAKSNGIVASSEETTIDPYITINGGEIKIIAFAKGIHTTSILTLTNATIDLNTIGTAVTGLKGIYINSGSYNLLATTGSGLRSDQEVAFTGGRTFLKCGASPETPINVPLSGAFHIKAGTLIALGGTPSGKASLSEPSHPAMIWNEALQSQSLLHLREGNREVFTFLLPISATYFLFSSDKFIQGRNYALYKEGNVLNGTQEKGLYSEGRYIGGTLIREFTASSIINP